MAQIEKPKVKLLGSDGNVFSVIGLCSKALKRAGLPEQAKELCSRIMNASSYDEALGICLEYVEVA